MLMCELYRVIMVIVIFFFLIDEIGFVVENVCKFFIRGRVRISVVLFVDLEVIIIFEMFCNISFNYVFLIENIVVEGDEGKK